MRATLRSRRSSSRPTARATLCRGARRPAPRTVFTTHTPVPAGNDSYPRRQVRRCSRGGLARWGSTGTLIAFGRTIRRIPRSRSASPRPPCGSAAAANGVSRRHGQVARAMWHELWPERPWSRCRSATSPTACTCRRGSAGRRATLLDRHLGETGCARRPTRYLGGRRCGSPTRICGRRASAANRARRVRPARAASPTGSRAATLREYVESAARALRSGRAHARLRPPSRHLQAARAADPRSRVDAVAARGRAPGAGRSRRQGPPA